jgi:methionyl-tRNA synthetase
MNTSSYNRVLVTSALPYANGPLHFGHIAGVYLPADIYTRHLKLSGKKVIHISGSDEHGVAIMQNAQKAKIPYQEYVNSWHQTHKQLFESYDINPEFFGQTSSQYHEEEVLVWFDVMNKAGAFEKRQEQQLQCQDCHNFLPDRFVEGECYVCGYKEARGDECPECGTWIDPLKLKNPVCKFCHSKNITVKDSWQWYLVLSKFEKEFKQWFATKKHWKNTVYPYVESLVKDSMHDRAITRDLDWGIKVPLKDADGKRFYVWFDAPIGYVSNTKEYLKIHKISEDYLKDWWLNPQTKIVNFIGKDNIIFHAIIFPMMSMISQRAKPVDELPANQYVNLFGKQFSKSKGWYVDADDAIKKFGADALRYYLISLIPEQADTSFTWLGLDSKVNNELANNIGNLVSRCLKFMHKNWSDGIESELMLKFWNDDKHEHVPLKELKKFMLEGMQKFQTALDQFEFRYALEIVMQCGSKANTYFSDAAPWNQFKTDPNLAKQTIADTNNAIILLSVMLEPFVPGLAKKMQQQLGNYFQSPEVVNYIYQQRWDKWCEVLKREKCLLSFEPGVLVPKIEKKDLEALEKEFLSKMQ